MSALSQVRRCTECSLLRVSPWKAACYAIETWKCIVYAMASEFWRLSPFIEHRKIEKSQKGATFVALMCVQQLERFSFSASLIPCGLDPAGSSTLLSCYRLTLRMHRPCFLGWRVVRFATYFTHCRELCS